MHKLIPLAIALLLAGCGGEKFFDCSGTFGLIVFNEPRKTPVDHVTVRIDRPIFDVTAPDILWMTAPFDICEETDSVMYFRSPSSPVTCKASQKDLMDMWLEQTKTHAVGSKDFPELVVGTFNTISGTLSMDGPKLRADLQCKPAEQQV